MSRTSPANELSRDTWSVLIGGGNPVKFRKTSGSGGANFGAVVATPPMTRSVAGGSMSSLTRLSATTSLPSADATGMFDDAEEDDLIQRQEGKNASQDAVADPPGESSTATITTEASGLTSAGVFDDADDDVDDTASKLSFEVRLQQSLKFSCGDSCTGHCPRRHTRDDVSSLLWPAPLVDERHMKSSSADHSAASVFRQSSLDEDNNRNAMIISTSFSPSQRRKDGKSFLGLPRIKAISTTNGAMESCASPPPCGANATPFSSFIRNSAASASSSWAGMGFGNGTGVSVRGPRTSHPHPSSINGAPNSTNGDKKGGSTSDVSKKENAATAILTVCLPQSQASEATAVDEKQTAKTGADHVPLHPRPSGARSTLDSKSIGMSHGKADPSSNKFATAPSANQRGGQQQELSELDRRNPFQERVGEAGRNHLPTSNGRGTPFLSPAKCHDEKNQCERHVGMKIDLQHEEGGLPDQGVKEHHSSPGQSIASKPPTPASVRGSSHGGANGGKFKTTHTTDMPAQFSGLPSSQVQPKNDATKKKRRPVLPLSKNLSQESGSVTGKVRKKDGDANTGNAGPQVLSSPSGVPGMEPESKKKSRKSKSATADDSAVGVPSKPQNQNQPKLDTSLFPVALYVMVRDETNNTQDDTVSWDRDNRSFLVRMQKPQSQDSSQQRGLEEVLYKYFPQWRDSSRPKEAFWSQLRNYGFMAERLPQNGDGVSATRYSHAHFHRGMTDFAPMRTLPPALRPNWSNTTRRKRTRDRECCDDTEGRTANSFSSTTTSALVEVDGAKSESGRDDVSGCVEKHPKASALCRGTDRRLLCQDDTDGKETHGLKD